MWACRWKGGRRTHIVDGMVSFHGNAWYGMVWCRGMVGGMVWYDMVGGEDQGWAASMIFEASISQRKT